MLVYRAPLPVPATAVLSVAVLPCRAPGRALGAGAALAARHRICLRYADARGRVRRHRGFLQANLAPGTRLEVAGCQFEARAVLLTLTKAAPAKAPSHGAALADRFRLPVGLTAWGLTALTGARATLRMGCRAAGGALVIHGVLRLQLIAPAATLGLRVPFIRLLAVADAPAGLRWRARGGVTGLYLCVKPGGQISGEVVLGLRCEGRPAAPAPAAAALLQRVREVTAKVTRMGATHAGPGHAVVRGQIEIDIYGMDAAGRSRWTGRSLPFSQLLALDGLTEADRLEPAATLERVGHDEARLLLTLALSLTALRTKHVPIEGQICRVEQVVGRTETTLQIEEPLRSGSPGGHRSRAEEREAFLPLPGPAEGWSELAVALSTPEAKAGRGGSGRWSVRALLGGTPLDGAPYPAPLQAVTGGTVDLKAEEALTAVPHLEAVGPTGVHVRTRLCQDVRTAQLERPVPAGAVSVEGSLPLPDECRSIAGLTVDGELNVVALVRHPDAGLRLSEGRIQGQAGRPVAALAYPVMYGDKAQLKVSVSIAETGADGAEKPLDSSANA